jgi:hypothetical protein
MGTGILALGIALAPLAIPSLHAVAAALWMATVALFVALLLLLWLAHGLRDPRALRTCLDDPVRRRSPV